MRVSQHSYHRTLSLECFKRHALYLLVVFSQARGPCSRMKAYQTAERPLRETDLMGYSHIDSSELVAKNIPSFDVIREASLLLFQQRDGVLSWYSASLRRN